MTSLCLKPYTFHWRTSFLAKLRSSCFADVLMGQQHVWAAGSCQQLFHCASTDEGAFTLPPLRCLNERIPSYCYVLILTVELQLSDGLRVWDMSAGQSHSLLLADGDCIQPVLLYCGQQKESTAGQSQKSWQRPTLLPVCLEVCTSRRNSKRRAINVTSIHHPICVCVCRWATSAACAAGDKAALSWQTRTSWV